MKRFAVAALLLVAALTATVFGQNYDFRAPITGTSAIFSGGLRAQRLAADSFTGAVKGTWKGLDTTYFGALGKRNTWTKRQAFSDTAATNGYTQLGDSVADYIAVYGQVLSRNRGNTSNWVSIGKPDLLARPSLFHMAARLQGMPAAGYWNAGFFNTSLDTIADAGDYRGLEAKATSTVSPTGTTRLSGVLGKVSITGTSKTAPWGAGCHSLVDIATGNTLSKAYGFFAELSNSGTMTAGSAFGSGAGTWKYGLDLSLSTFGTADILLAGGATLASASTTLTITETNIALAGAVTATSVAIGGGDVVAKMVVVGTDLYTIIGNDTFVAAKITHE
jgi:hypothetical protein